MAAGLGLGLVGRCVQPRGPGEAAADSSVPPGKVRVAGIVLKWITADKESNYRRVEPLIRRAAAQGAQIVVTTECFLDGYAIRDKSMPIEQWQALSETLPDGPYIRRLRGLADELNIHLVAGFVERLEGSTYNTAVLIGPDGGLIGRYHKQHLEHELARNTPGAESPVFQTPYGRVGLIICADRRRPELVRKIAAHADLLICPSGGMWGPEKNDFHLQNRSRENNVPIVFVHPVEFLVTGPDGSILDRRFAGRRMSLEPGEIGGPDDVVLVALYDLPLSPKRGSEGVGDGPAAKASSKPTDAGQRMPLIGNWPDAHTVARAVPLGAIRLGGFLGAHVDANNRQSIPAGLKTVLPQAFEARARGQTPARECARLATDSDFYKWFEGACYAIAYDTSLTDLAAQVERYADLLVGLQEADGYLGTRLSPARPFDENVRHDLYVAGHFLEAAVAHFQATGGRKMLDAAVRLADYYLRAWESGHPYFKQIGQEHPEIEIALVRLYRATGLKRFLDFSAALTRQAVWSHKLSEVRAGASRRHAVRLCYQLSGAAELYMETGDAGVFEFLPSLWDELVTTRMYVTGGIGYNEVVPEDPYDLPHTVATKPNRDIAETCASVSLMMFGWRMHAVTGDSRAFDVIETILYNHYLGAVSSDHLAIFYYNPLRRVGDLTGRSDHGGSPVARTRLPRIHSTTCCMPNAWRFFAQLPEFVMSVRKDGLAVNLYTDARVRHVLPDGTGIQVEMQTKYPHEGGVGILFKPDKPAKFALYLRMPGWCASPAVSVNGHAARPVNGGTYHTIEREWRSGDEVRIDLPMKPAVIHGSPQVPADRGQVALRRGPLIYCLEREDAAGLDLEKVRLVLDDKNPLGSLTEEFHPEWGLYALKAPAVEMPSDPPIVPREVRLVPFYFRANRGDDSRWITWIPSDGSPRP
ncbi:MAG: glycoside hydrolase family 127 protein [Phycisphaerae bacterium]|jgi:hypothetical protein